MGNFDAVVAFAIALSYVRSEQRWWDRYPGTLEGIDDFYQTSQNLTVIETTNGVYNDSLFALHVTAVGTVPYWIRVIVANRAAVTAADWEQWFYKHNSGTYNNQVGFLRTEKCFFFYALSPSI